MANSIKMEDPDGKEFDIVAAGVESLERLGWKRVESAPAKSDDKSDDKSDAKTTASKTTASKTSK